MMRHGCRERDDGSRGNAGENEDDAVACHALRIAAPAAWLNAVADRIARYFAALLRNSTRSSGPKPLFQITQQ